MEGCSQQHLARSASVSVGCWFLGLTLQASVVGFKGWPSGIGCFLGLALVPAFRHGIGGLQTGIGLAVRHVQLCDLCFRWVCLNTLVGTPDAA
jgi:hypothetical protein